ncbi:general substrate transporter [Favolaschia claudopus]|uniref:General substrate transporter n=1 Tax=Favolaschia claudopus TaxID=2862362 RepID=A0AAW0BER4_9AGAR
MSTYIKPPTYLSRYPRSLAGIPLLYISSASASLGDALLGYSQGITAVFQVQRSFIRRIYGMNVSTKQIIQETTGVDALWPALLIASLSITAFFSSLASAYTSNALGRRKTIRIGASLYFFASTIQLSAPNLITLLVGRAIQGLGAGLLSTTVPIYQVEIAPANARGILVGIEAFCMNAGYAVSAWVGYAFFMDSRAEHAWRGPFAVQAVVSLVLFVWTFFLPESPRWLIQNGYKSEGLCVLADLHAKGDVTDAGVTNMYHGIVHTLEAEEEKAGDVAGAVAPWSALFRDYRRRTVIGVTSRMFAQLNGINAILHFLPEHLAQTGSSIPRALFYSACCSLLYPAGTVPGMLCIDKLGRRRSLIVGSVALACSLVVVGNVQRYVDSWPKALAFLGGDRGVLLGICTYLFFFGATWGPIPWLLSAELFPLRMRGKGMSAATASDWLFECIVGVATPSLLSMLGGGYYFILVGACILSGFVVWLLYLETGGLPLESIAGVFGDALPPETKLEFDRNESAVEAVGRVQRWSGCGYGHLRARSVVSTTSTQVEGMSSRSSLVSVAPRNFTAGSSQVTLVGGVTDDDGEKAPRDCRGADREAYHKNA